MSTTNISDPVAQAEPDPSTSPAADPTTPARAVARTMLGGAMIFAGLSHLFWGRRSFRAQVPGWVPLDADGVVMASGGVEITLGAVLVLARRDRALFGRLLALFFVAVFPGNLAQYLDRRDAFGLDSDTKRLVRLFFQPVLVWLALWSTGSGRRTAR